MPVIDVAKRRMLRPAPAATEPTRPRPVETGRDRGRDALAEAALDPLPHVLGALGELAELMPALGQALLEALGRRAEDQRDVEVAGHQLRPDQEKKGKRAGPQSHRPTRS